MAHRYEEGQAIFYQGNPPLAVYCIYSGAVKLYKKGRKDREIVTHVLGPGESLGYRSFLANEPYEATAEALESTVVCMITKEMFYEILREDTEVSLRLLAKLATELRAAEERLATHSQLTVTQRAARLLLWLYDGFQDRARGGGDINVPLLREDMARMIGAAPETLSRVLHDLAGQGILEIDRKHVSILNFSRLKDAAGLRH